MSKNNMVSLPSPLTREQLIRFNKNCRYKWQEVGVFALIESATADVLNS
jgi:hypothetical protein